jgi:hypothetical protein
MPGYIHKKNKQREKPGEHHACMNAQEAFPVCYQFGIYKILK